MLLTLDNLRLLPLVDQSSCTVHPQELKGCYDCDSGASFTFSCVTDFGETLAQIDCGTLLVHQRCDTKNQSYTRNVALNVANVSIECHVDCPAGGNYFWLKGRLRRLPHSIHNDYRTQQARSISFGGITITVPQWMVNIKDTVVTVADLPYQIQLVVTIFLVLGLLYFILLCNPALRLWKKTYSILALMSLTTPVYGSLTDPQYPSTRTTVLVIGLLTLLYFGLLYLGIRYWSTPPQYTILVPKGIGGVPQRKPAPQGNRRESPRPQKVRAPI